MIFLLFFPYQ